MGQKSASVTTSVKASSTRTKTGLDARAAAIALGTAAFFRHLQTYHEVATKITTVATVTTTRAAVSPPLICIVIGSIVCDVIDVGGVMLTPG